MFKLFLSLIYLAIFFHSTKLSKLSHRRVFNGFPRITFDIPFSSVVKIYVVETFECSGVLTGAQIVLTSAHCVIGVSASDIQVGVGSLFVERHFTYKVEQVNTCGDLDVAMLRLEESIPANGKIQYFTKDRWRLDDLTTMVKDKTFLCGYGLYEGPNRDTPAETASDILRCVPYIYSANYETILTKSQEAAQWPPPPSEIDTIPPFTHDKRYMESISRDPEAPEAKSDPYFPMGCKGDSGGPVFYSADKGKFLLQGIYHGEPNICGNATLGFDYDSAVLMTAVDTCDWK